MVREAENDRFRLVRRYRETRDKDLLHQYYNHPDYASVYREPKRKWLEKAQTLASLMNLQEGDRVLDVGCGPMLLREPVLASHAEYTGLDIARHFRPDVVADAECLGDLQLGSFDWVVLADVLEHLHEPAAALRGAFTIGDRVLLVVPHLYRLEALGRLLPEIPDDRHLHKKSFWAWKQTAQTSGGRVDSALGFFFIPSFAANPHWDRVRRFDNWLRKRPLLIAADRWLQTLALKFPPLRVLAQEVIFLCTAASPPPQLEDSVS